MNSLLMGPSLNDRAQSAVELVSTEKLAARFKKILELNNSKQISLPKVETNNNWWPLVASALIFYIGFLGLREGLE